MWLKRFLTECNILTDTRLNPDEIVPLFARPADEMKSLLGGTENHTKEIVNITAIRLPDANQKFLTVSDLKGLIRSDAKYNIRSTGLYWI